MATKLFINFLIILFSAVALAQQVPELLPFQGRLADVNTGIPISTSTSVKFRIYPPAGTCYIYEDTQTVSPNTYGVFSTLIGASGNSTGPANSFGSVFNNSSTGMTDSCAGTYIPSANDWRRIEISIFDGSSYVNIPQMQTIGSSPFAINSKYANYLGGKTAGQFIQVNGALTQANAESLVGGGDATSLHHHDSRYARVDGANTYTGNIQTSSNIYTTGGSIGVGTTSTAADIQISKTSPSLRLTSTSGGAGTPKIDFYSGSVTQRASIRSSESTNELRIFTGTNEAVRFDANQNAIFSGSLSIAGTTGLGKYTAAQEPALLTSLAGIGASATGTVWVNSTTNKVRYWDGASAQTIADLNSVVNSVTAGTGISLGGTALSPVINLTNTGIAAGTYTKLTVDAQGRASSGATLRITDIYSNVVGNFLTGGSCTAGQALAYNSVTDTVSCSAIVAAVTNATTLANGKVWIGDIGNKAQEQSISGDATISNTGALTISNDAVTSAKIINNAVTSAKINDGEIVNADISASAAIDATKINTGIVSNAEFNYLDGVTSGVQGQLDAKLNLAGGTMSGALDMGNNNINNVSSVSSSFVSTNTLRIFNGVNYVQLTAPALGGNVNYVLPSADGTAGYVLRTDGAGVLSWVSPTSGSVTSVGATAPIASSGGATPTISISQANSTTNGYLSSADWNTFNNKQTSTLNTNQILVGSAGNVATAVSMSGDATIVSSGALTIANDAITTTKIADSAVTSAKINDGTIANVDINASAAIDATKIAGGSVSNTEFGYLDGVTSAIQTQVDAKLNLAGGTMTGAINMGGQNITNAGNIELAASKHLLLGQYAADPATGGWGNGEKGRTWFNTTSNEIKYWDGSAVKVLGAVGAAVTSVGGTSPISSSGGTTPTISISQANSTTNGYLSSTDWNTFNNKQTSTLNSAKILVGNAGNVATEVNLSGDASIDNTGALTIANNAITSGKINDGAIVNADINASAAIDATKIAGGSVSNTEFGYLDGVTSAIQTQLDGKVSNFTSQTYIVVLAHIFNLRFRV